jgi:DNA-binding MarR family transcriptional regulator/N-acetylglutamate synthase-like GNAT family acetyltransferase
MRKESINNLRQVCRKLVRELGILELKSPHLKKTPQHWHALVEIDKEPGITMSKLGNFLLLSISAVSRIVNGLIEHGLVTFKEGADKREKYLHLTKRGEAEVASIDEYSNTKIKGAFEFLTEKDQDQIIEAIGKYAEALEKSRLVRENLKIHTLSSSRTIRKQIKAMVDHIQKQEFLIPITDDINVGILKAEEEYYYNNSYNFWYAVDGSGTIIGSIGLKRIDTHNAEIKKFFVDSKYRGKGVAQKLMNTLVKAASKHKFDYLYLGTVGVLKAARSFYNKHGFFEITKQQLPAKFEACPLDTEFLKVNLWDLQHK